MTLTQSMEPPTRMKGFEGPDRRGICHTTKFRLSKSSWKLDRGLHRLNTRRVAEIRWFWLWMSSGSLLWLSSAVRDG